MPNCHAGNSHALSAPTRGCHITWYEYFFYLRKTSAETTAPSPFRKLSVPCSHCRLSTTIAKDALHLNNSVLCSAA